MKTLSFKLADKEYGALITADISDFITCAKELGSRSSNSYCGLDIETGRKPDWCNFVNAGRDPYTSSVRLIQLYFGGSSVCILDCRDLVYSDFAPLRSYFRTLKFCAHSATFEQSFFEYLDFKDLDIMCSMIMTILADYAEKSAFQIESRGTKPYSLKSLAKQHFGIELPKEGQTSDWSAPVLKKSQYIYAAKDAVICRMLALRAAKKIKKYKLQIIHKLFKKMQSVVVEMQLTGMPINLKKHEKLIREWKREARRAEVKCRKYFGDINLNSSPQKSNWLENYAPLKDELPEWPRTPSGSYSFSKAELSDYLHLKEIAALMDHNKYGKLLSTYAESLQDHINPVTNRVHTSFILGEVKTGRLSSRGPNLQNIPRTEAVRDMFDIDQENSNLCYVVADFGQIELRVAGELSGDEVIRSVYAAGGDLHTKMAQIITGRQLVTKDERQMAKAANFGFLYGMGAAKFISYARGSYGAEFTEAEAKKTKQKFYRSYSTYIKWCDRTRDRAGQLGYVRTPMGRIRRLLKDEVYTKAVNHPVQGGAAEVLFISMLLLRKNLARLGAKLASCIHDEIIVETRRDKAEATKAAVEDAMVRGMLRLFPDAPTFNLAKAHIGKTWNEAKD